MTRTLNRRDLENEVGVLRSGLKYRVNLIVQTVMAFKKAIYQIESENYVKKSKLTRLFEQLKRSNKVDPHLLQ